MNEEVSNNTLDLNARLASACNCAYGINEDTGTYTPSAPYDTAVNWTGKPVAIAAQEKGANNRPMINACLVGLNNDGIIVAFRGTIPPQWTIASVEDWWQDIVGSTPMSAPPLPGKVHSGFWHALDTLWAEVLKEIKALQSTNPGAAIYITGHSKGGPLATLGAARMYLEAHIQATKVITFASPAPGDKPFVDQYPIDKLPVTRFENYFDIVPFLPPHSAFFTVVEHVLPAKMRQEFCKAFPYICNALVHASQWNYTLLGELNYIEKSGSVVGANNYHANVLYRLAQIFGELLGFDGSKLDLRSIYAMTPATVKDSGLTRIGAAHCIGCKSNNPNKFCAGGYITGAGAGGICLPP